MKIHIAQKGDTLWSIAKKYSISFEDVEKANTQLSSPGAIYPGMKIKVPVEKVSVTNHQDVLENKEEVAAESIEATSQNNEEQKEEALFRSDGGFSFEEIGGVPPVSGKKLNIEETLPPLPPYPTIPKPPFALPVSPPPPIVNTSSAYGNYMLQKQGEEAPQTEKAIDKDALTGKEETQSSYSKPQVGYMGDVTQEMTNPQEYTNPAQGYYQATQGSYQGPPSYPYGVGAVPSYQPKPPCGCGGGGAPGMMPQPPIPYPVGHSYGYPPYGPAPYGYQEPPFGYPSYGGTPGGHLGYGGAPYGSQIQPYGYQEQPYGYQGYGAPMYAHPPKYYAPLTPGGHPQHFQGAQVAGMGQEQAIPPAIPTPLPVQPFPTASFQGQGYPAYYRDEENTNFGVPPIDEED